VVALGLHAAAALCGRVARHDDQWPMNRLAQQPGPLAGGCFVEELQELDAELCRRTFDREAAAFIL
jgi:hypothetical protein